MGPLITHLNGNHHIPWAFWVCYGADGRTFHAPSARAGIVLWAWFSRHMQAPPTAKRWLACWVSLIP